MSPPGECFLLAARARQLTRVGGGRAVSFWPVRYRLVAKRAVRAMVVVVSSPAARRLTGRRQALEYFQGQELLTESAMEALRVPILPGTPWLDIQGFDLLTQIT